MVGKEGRIVVRVAAEYTGKLGIREKTQRFIVDLDDRLAPNVDLDNIRHARVQSLLFSLDFFLLLLQSAAAGGGSHC